MIVTVRDFDSGDPIEGAYVAVDGYPAAATDGSGRATCLDGASLIVYRNSMDLSVDAQAVRLTFDSAGDQEVWISGGDPMPGGGGVTPVGP